MPISRYSCKLRVPRKHAIRNAHPAIQLLIHASQSLQKIIARETRYIEHLVAIMIFLFINLCAPLSLIRNSLGSSRKGATLTCVFSFNH